MKEPKLLYGKYKGYEVGYTTGGQIFPREGWYLSKITKSGTVKDILYLEEALPKAKTKSKIKK
jgi:hypothetical protein